MNVLKMISRRITKGIERVRSFLADGIDPTDSDAQWVRR